MLDRDEDESARKLVLLPLMSGRRVEARTIVLTSAQDMVAALESAEDSFGYTPVGLLQIRRTRGVKVLSLDAVVSNAKSVASGDYPWPLTHELASLADAPAKSNGSSTSF